MKKTVLYLSLLIFGATSCSQDVSPGETYTKDIKQAKRWFNGKWTLSGVDSMSPITTVPDVQLIIYSNNQIAVVENGKQIDKVDFEIVQTAYNLQLKTNVQLRKNNWYVRNPALQISGKRMYLDTGTAQDFPGYEFVRVN